jgi:hypothetical protein
MKWKGHGYQKRYIPKIIEEFGDVKIMIDQMG